MTNEDEIVGYLQEMFPEPKCELNFKNPYELLIAVILSAQCTDVRVNKVTPELFIKYTTPYDMAVADIEDVKRIIKSCGFYNNKSKNIINACKDIVKCYNGQVPTDKESLLKLNGVGNKTANVVLSVTQNANVIAVDTHVLRVSNRLGLCKTDNPDKCEVVLTKKFKTGLDKLHYRMVLFGRYFCSARKPCCSECKLKSICKYYRTNK